MTDDTLREECQELLNLLAMDPYNYPPGKQLEGLLAFARDQQARGLQEAAEILRQYAAVCQPGAVCDRQACIAVMAQQIYAQATAREQA